MESTIRFKNDNSYTCKQLNLISATDPIANIESVNGNNVLAISSNIDIDLETYTKNSSSSLIIKNLSASKPVQLECYVSFGYTRKTVGDIFVLNVTTIPSDLYITNAGGILNIGYGLDTSKPVPGSASIKSIAIKEIGDYPIRELELKHVITESSEFVKIYIGDILYNAWDEEYGYLK